MGYSTPRLHQGKSWYIDFLAFDPASGKLKRKKYHVDNIKGTRARKAQAAEMITMLTEKLRTGWTPWAELNNSRGYALLTDVMERYLQHVERQSRRKTVFTYTSRVNILRQYLSTLPRPPRYAYQIDQAFITSFLDWIYLDRGLSARTRNNYRGWAYSFCEFMVQRGNLQENPVAKIGSVREDAKIRKDLTPEQLRQLTAYLKEHDPYFLLACSFEYFTFIRPTELTFLRVRDIDTRGQRVFVSGTFSKNRQDGYVALNDTLMTLLFRLRVLEQDSEWYLFGKGMRPGPERLGPDRFNKRWQQIRRALKWPKELQFYSLKDSGIRDLANAEGVVTARDQARHSDISTTNKYIQGAGKRVHDSAKHFTGNMGPTAPGLNH